MATSEHAAHLGRLGMQAGADKNDMSMSEYAAALGNRTALLVGCGK